jgi:hypothetical protein
MTERGGLAGFALMPVVWALKALGGFRRFGDKAMVAAHTAQAATPELVTSTVAPATPAVSSFTERAVAAGMTLVLAGGVTVGAATIVHRHTSQAPAVRAEAATSTPRALPSPSAASPGRARNDVSPRTDKPSPNEPVVVPVPKALPTPSPSAEPSTAPNPDPSTAPSPEPSPSPTGATGATGAPTPDPSTEPPVGPAPDWSMSFTSSTDSVEVCSCDPTSKLVASNVQLRDDHGVAFSSQIKGVVADRSGDPTWPVFLFMNGDTGAGRISYNFDLTSAAGRFLYRGVGTLTDSTSGDEGSMTYTFSGTYRVMDDAVPAAGVPYGGTMIASLSIWPDGTLYAVSFDMHDATP